MLGDREAVDALTPTLDHIVIDRAAQMAAETEAIMLLRRRVPVVAFVNNHFAGYAPETVKQFTALTDAVASAEAMVEAVGMWGLLPVWTVQARDGAEFRHPFQALARPSFRRRPQGQARWERDTMARSRLRSPAQRGTSPANGGRVTEKQNKATSMGNVDPEALQKRE
jgi:hypothetical protein